MADRPRDWPYDCRYRADWERERSRWLAWWEGRLGVSWWLRRLGA